MEPTSTRPNIPTGHVDPRTMVADPRTMGMPEKRLVQEHRPKKSEELTVEKTNFLD